MAYSVAEVSAYIIEKSAGEGFHMNNFKLQRLLYYVQAGFLVSTGRKCFDEGIMAWSIGPVVPESYKEYRIYGSGAIPVTVHDRKADAVLPSDQKLIDEIIEQCRYYSASDLLEIIRQQEPWKKAYACLKENGDIQEITPESLMEFFSD